jgi:phosphoribosylformylglycinamidine synthase
VALVNCLNFGNPEHPEVMWQLSEAIDGMAEACRALRIPVIGGNVSFYNESGGRDIDPTPVVAVLGVIERLDHRPPRAAFEEGASVVLLGAPSTELGGSRWAMELRSHRGGKLPGIDLRSHETLLALIADLVRSRELVAGIHDVSGGGLGVALAECAMSSGIGCEVRGVAGHGELFSESPGRVVLCSVRPNQVCERAEHAGVPAQVIGTAGGTRLVVEGLLDLSVAELTESWRSALPAALGEPA